MAVKWAANELEQFAFATNASFSTDSRKHRAWTRGSIYLTRDTKLVSPEIAPMTSIWASVYMGGEPDVDNGARLIPIGFSDEIDSVAKLSLHAFENHLELVSLVNGVFNILATAATGIVYDTTFKVNVQNLGTNGTIRCFIGDSSEPVMSYTGDLTGGSWNAITRIISQSVQSGSSYATCCVSEFIVSDGDIRGHKVVTRVPNAITEYTGFTGSYSDIAEVYLDVSSGIISDAVGQRSEFGLSDPIGGENTSVIARIASIAASAGAASPAQKIKFGIRNNNVLKESTQTLVEGILPYNHVVNAEDIAMSGDDAVRITFESVA